MNVRNWRYIGSTKHAIVSVKHGPTSGNFLISYGQEIVLIDYDVFDSKSYYFYVDDELCSVYVEKKGNQFSYTFDINDEIKTPLNKQRSKKAKTDLLKSFAAIFGVLTILLLVIGLGYFNSKRVDRNNLANHYSVSQATVDRLVKKSRTSTIIYYSAEYVYQDFDFPEEYKSVIREHDQVRGKMHIKHAPDKEVTTPFGLNIQVGDSFEVHYVEKKKEVNKILLEKPSETLIRSYQARLTEWYLTKNVDVQYLQVGCILDLLYSIDGLEAYGHFYHQDVSPSINPDFNEVTYHKLTQSPQFLEDEGICW